MQNNIYTKFFDLYMELINKEEMGWSKEDLIKMTIQTVAEETSKSVEELSVIANDMIFPETSFIYKDEFCIVIPNLDEDGMDYIEPYIHYGEPYNTFMMEFHKKRLDFLLRDTPYEVSIYQTDDWYEVESEDDEEEENEIPMFEGQIQFKNSQDELEDFITGRYCALADVIEELESLCEDAISELSPKDMQVRKCSNWIDEMDKLLKSNATTDIEGTMHLLNFQYMQVGSNQVETISQILNKKLRFNFETLPTQEDAKTVLKELLMVF